MTRFAISMLMSLLAAGAAGCESTHEDEAQSAEAREANAPLDGVAAVEASAVVTPLLQNQWRFVELHHQALAPGLANDRPAELRFDAAEQRVSGDTGINAFSGTYELDGYKLRFGPLAMTRRAGPEPLMEQEAALGRALSRTEAWRAADDGIKLVDASGNALASLTRVR